jgi:hypothetical protein
MHPADKMRKLPIADPAIAAKAAQVDLVLLR